MRRVDAVLANVKVRNLKANHSRLKKLVLSRGAVLANVKVRNLKANHSGQVMVLGGHALY